MAVLGEVIADLLVGVLERVVRAFVQQRDTRAAGKFANAEEELGGDVGFVQDGYMVIATGADAHALREVVPYQQELGVQTGFLTPDEVVERWPELELEGIELACYEETSGYADPVRTVETLARSAAGSGLDVREETEVLEITTSGGRGRL